MVEKKTIQRILLALKQLNSKGELASSRFCDETGISSRTFQRLIKDLREILDIPLTYDIKNNVYIIDRSAVISKKDEDILDTFDKLNSNNEMLFFYSFAKSLIESEYFFPPINAKEKGKKVTDYNQILRVLAKFIPDQDKDISGHIEYYISNHYKLNMKIKFKNMIENIVRSLKSKKLITFTYNKHKTNAEPLKVVHYHGKWYMVCYLANWDKNSKTKVVRTYNLSHIENMSVSKKNFTKHGELNTEIKDTFGFFRDDNTREAVIRFYSDSVIKTAKETVWHEGQKTRSGTDKEKGKYYEYIIEYPESGGVEIISRVLGFGEHAEIVSPENLRDQWIGRIVAMNNFISNN